MNVMITFSHGVMSSIKTNSYLHQHHSNPTHGAMPSHLSTNKSKLKLKGLMLELKIYSSPAVERWTTHCNVKGEMFIITFPHMVHVNNSICIISANRARDVSNKMVPQHSESKIFFRFGSRSYDTIIYSSEYHLQKYSSNFQNCNIK